MSDAQSGYAAIGELELYYEVHGSGPPLVLLHGAYMTVDMFGPLLPGLAVTRQVIAPELQGHGRTNDPADRPITYEQMADDVAALIWELGVAPADVVGFSMGSGAALQLAIRHPEAVRRLVVISGSYRHDGMQPEMLAMIPTITPEMFAGSPMEEAYKQLSPHPGRFEALVGKLKALDATPFEWPEEEVRGVTAPALVVVGDSDVVTVEHAAQMYRLLGGGGFGDFSAPGPAQLAVLPGTSHFMPSGSGVLDRSALLLAIIPPFLGAEASAG
jgi:pimeloyl-ACP methyl ester carboxylesterase